MPSLTYVSHEKRPGHPHHYKAGALNAPVWSTLLFYFLWCMLSKRLTMHSMSATRRNKTSKKPRRPRVAASIATISSKIGHGSPMEDIIAVANYSRVLLHCGCEINGDNKEDNYVICFQSNNYYYYF